MPSQTSLPSAILWIATSQFPTLSETFIRREMLALLQQGVEFRIVSLKAARELEPHKSLRQRCLNLHWHQLQHLPCALRCLWQQPRACLSTLWQLCRYGWRRPLELAKNLAIFPYALAIGARMRQEGVQQIYCHWANMASTLGWIIARVFGIRLDMAIHGEDIFTPDALLARKLVQAHSTVVCSAWFAEHLRQHVAPEAAERIHVNYHGLDHSILAASTRRLPGLLRQRHAPLRLLSIGRLVPTKGLDLLIRACIALHRDDYAIECDIIGAGPEQDALQALIDEYHLGQRIRLLGPRPQEEVISSLLHSDIFVLTPRFLPGWPPDGIPNVLAEAMALGVPVISRRLGAIPELIDAPDCGFLIEQDRPQALVEAIQQALADPQQTARRAERAQQRVLHMFDSQNNIRALLHHLQHRTQES